jgi:hypothetical protein
VASYRDTFRLLLQFAQKELGKSPSKLAMTDLNTTLIGAFLDNLEKARANSSRSRNLRLTAIRSFFHYTAMEPGDHCIDVGCEHCIGYWKHDGRVSYCTHDCHKNFRAPEVPYNHCNYLGCVDCPGIVTQGIVVSRCTCTHHVVQ